MKSILKSNRNHTSKQFDLSSYYMMEKTDLELDW